MYPSSVLYASMSLENEYTVHMNIESHLDIMTGFEHNKLCYFCCMITHIFMLC